MNANLRRRVLPTSRAKLKLYVVFCSTIAVGSLMTSSQALTRLGGEAEKGPPLKPRCSERSIGRPGVATLAWPTELLPLTNKDLRRANVNCHCGDAWSLTHMAVELEFAALLGATTARNIAARKTFFSLTARV